MRSTTAFIALVVSIASTVGCSKGGSPSLSSPSNSATKELDFDPKLVLKWPAAPRESHQALPVEGGEFKIYSASLTEKRPGGLIIFGVDVEEYPEKTLKAYKPGEMLTEHEIPFHKEETNRKEIEHGRKKYPGFDITRQHVNPSGRILFMRSLVVMAGPRIYAVSVSSTKEEWLSGPDVKEFFDSFEIRE
jgi:hypothetical protein